MNWSYTIMQKVIRLPFLKKVPLREKGERIMLYKELLNVYQQNEYLRETFDFDVSYERLKEYIRIEVQQGNDYLSPFRYSKMYRLNLEDSINFFLSISSPSKDDFIKIVYKYKCEECGAINFFTSKDVLNDDLECTNCGENVYGLRMDTDRFVLVFELSRDLKMNLTV